MATQRTFAKTINGIRRTRTVHSPADEVAATFDGFVEMKPSKPASGRSTPPTGPAGGAS